MDEAEINIGANGNNGMFSDDEGTLFTQNLHHEDAAFDYCTQPVSPPPQTVTVSETKLDTEATADPQPIGSPNGCHRLQFLNGQGKTPIISTQGAPFTCYTNRRGWSK